MIERPIIFSGEMVSAILEGRKTMTRRVIKPQPEVPWAEWQAAIIYRCPYGQPGDRLWVREAFTGDWRGTGIPERGYINYRADGEIPDQYREGNYWRSPIHMPRWASRITLEITKIRVERLNDISPEDCFKEGFELDSELHFRPFKEAWNKLNRKRGYSWGTQPWVWVIEFKREGK